MVVAYMGYMHSSNPLHDNIQQIQSFMWNEPNPRGLSPIIGALQQAVIMPIIWPIVICRTIVFYCLLNIAMGFLWVAAVVL
jgi:hypothetical protein